MPQARQGNSLLILSHCDALVLAAATSQNTAGHNLLPSLHNRFPFPLKDTLKQGHRALTSGQAVADNDQGHHDNDERNEEVHDAADGKVERVHEMPTGQGPGKGRDVRGSAGRDNHSLAAPRHDRGALQHRVALHQLTSKEAM